MSRDADLAFAHRLADAADAITMARFRASDLVVETKPDLTPVSEADRAAEEAIRALVARERPGEGVFGEEFGDDGARGALDRRPDRRDEELRPRHPGVGNAARARARRRRRRRGRVGAGARPPLVGGARRGRGWAAASGEPCRVSAVARIEDCVVSTTGRATCRRAGRSSSRRAWAMRGLERLLAALPRRRRRPRRRGRPRHAAVGLRRSAPRRRGGRRPLHDLRGRRARARAGRG